MSDNTMIIKCLESRKNWYKKAIEMKQNKIPYENHFDFPSGDNIEFWQGAIHELSNTLDMMYAIEKQNKIENEEIKKRYRTKEETIKYFKQLAFKFEEKAHRENDLMAKGQADAYEMAAFSLERNMQ